MPSIAEWLRASRTSQAMPENGRPWTQDYFLARIKTETGWAPAYANYNKLEQGKSQPRPDTLSRLVAFWARYGIAGPDLTPEPEPLSLELRAVLAAERQAAAMEGILSVLLARARPEDDRIEGLLDGLLDGVERSEVPKLLRRPTPDPHPTTA